MFKFKVMIRGKEEELTVQEGKYYWDNTAIRVHTVLGELYTVLTVNLEPLPSSNLAYIDINNCPIEIINKLENKMLIRNTMETRVSGYVNYPLYDITELRKVIR